MKKVIAGRIRTHSYRHQQEVWTDIVISKGIWNVLKWKRRVDMGDYVSKYILKSSLNMFKAKQMCHFLESILWYQLVFHNLMTLLYIFLIIINIYLNYMCTEESFPFISFSIGENIKLLLDRPDGAYCFRLHKNRVFYVRYNWAC